MKRHITWFVLLISLFLIGCTPTVSSETTLAPTETVASEETPMIEPFRDKEPTPPRTDTPVTPLPGVREGHPIGETTEPTLPMPMAQLSTWTQLKNDLPGHGFSFSLPFHTVEVTAETGSLSLPDKTTGKSVSLSNQSYGGQSPAVYWLPAANQMRDVLRVIIYDETSKVVHDGNIRIDMIGQPSDDSIVFLARLEQSNLVMFPSPIGIGTTITSKAMAPNLSNLIRELTPETRQEVTGMPWISPIEAGTDLLGATIDKIPDNISAYRVILPSATMYQLLGDVMLFYDASNQKILGYGLRE